MPILRTERDTGYTVISNEIVNRTDMSLKAKGLLWYLLSKPDDWSFTVGSLTKYAGSDGKDSVRSGIEELKELGYLEIDESPRICGKFVGGVWTIRESPPEADRVGKTAAEKPRRENRGGKPDTAIYIVTNTEEPITEELNTPYSPPEDAVGTIVAYLNEVCGTSYRSTSQKTRRLVSARLKEGFTVDDFKRVIRVKADAWLNDPKMRQYLRPETLFGTKFESYLNEAPRKASDLSRFQVLEA